MPYSIRKLPNKDLYRVVNKRTGQIHARATSLENAKRQVALLHMIDARKDGEGLLQQPVVTRLETSPRKGKKLRAILSNGRTIDFGSASSQTFSEGAPVTKMQNYWRRHLANPIERQRIEGLELSPALLSAYILWYGPSIKRNMEVLNDLLRHGRR